MDRRRDPIDPDDWIDIDPEVEMTTQGRRPRSAARAASTNHPMSPGARAGTPVDDVCAALAGTPIGHSMANAATGLQDELEEIDAVRADLQGRGVGGALLFVTPLLMTMELWRQALAVDRYRLAALAVGTVLVVVVLARHLGGSGRFGWPAAVVDAGVAFLAAALTVRSSSRHWMSSTGSRTGGTRSRFSCWPCCRPPSARPTPAPSSGRAALPLRPAGE